MRSTASAINDPISVSVFTLIMPTCRTYSFDDIGRDMLSNVFVTVSTANSIPPFKSSRFISTTAALHPSEYIDRANAVAVVIE